MNYEKAINKITAEIKDRKIAENFVRALDSAPCDFRLIFEAWLEDRSEDYTFQGISLSMIQEKEKCSYLQALMRMQLLITNPDLVSGYLKWTPINKDWGR